MNEESLNKMSIEELREYLVEQIDYSHELRERIYKAQDFIRNESYLNDAEIDELCEILEGDK